MRLAGLTKLEPVSIEGAAAILDSLDATFQSRR